MPDHMHFFVRGDDQFDLCKWVNGLKRAMSVALGATSNKPLWQPGFFDHVLRNDEAMHKNGNTYGTTLSVPDWQIQPTNGRIKEQSLRLTVRECRGGVSPAKFWNCGRHGRRYRDKSLAADTAAATGG